MTQTLSPARRGRRYKPVSPATLQLAQEGSSLLDIAEQAGCSISLVGMALAGDRAMPDRIARALEEALGQRGAWRVLGLVPERD